MFWLNQSVAAALTWMLPLSPPMPEALALIVSVSGVLSVTVTVAVPLYSVTLDGVRFSG
jgi:hypothetical protein